MLHWAATYVIWSNSWKIQYRLLLDTRIKQQFSIIQFSRSVMSNSLQPHELQYARPPVHCQLPEFTQTYVHRVGDAIQLSHPLSSPSPPAFNLSQQQGLFLMNQFFASDGRTTGASVSASVLPVNIQGWSPLRLTDLISLLSKGFLGDFSSTTVWRHQILYSHPFNVSPFIQLWSATGWLHIMEK